MEQEHVARNAADRERLHALVARLSEEELQHPLGDGWTVAAALAHLAFWDRYVLARWGQYERDGAFLALPDRHVDLANEAALPQWLALPPRRAAALALVAAEEVDRRIAGLAPEAVGAALATDRPAMVDRSRHRRAHLDAIEGALGR